MENAIDKLHAQQLGAVVELKAKEEEHKNAYQKLHAHIISVLTRNLDTNAVKVGCSDSSARIEIGNLGIDLYFEQPFHVNEGKERMLMMNFGCFGSFDKNNADAVKYCEVLGHVAGIMDILETQLFKTDEAKRLWNEFDSARHAMYRAADNERRIRGEIQDIETAARKEKILAQVIPGCRIVVKKASPWRDPVIKTIEHITSKNILFKEDWGRRTKKDELISNLMCSRWEIA